MTRILGVIAAVGLAAGPARADEPPPVAALRATAYELVDAADEGSLAIRIALARGVEIGNVAVRVVDAAVGNRREPGLADAFVPRPAADAAGAMIALAIDHRRVNRAATYTVTLELTETSGASVKPVTAALSLVHPAAKLRAVPGALVIARTGWLPGRGAWELPAVELEETSGATRITSLAARDLRTAQHGGAPVAATLALEAPAVIGPGGRAPVRLALGGDAPGGVTAKGSVELRAPQLAEPITVTYELRSRVHALTVAAVLILGLAAGLAVKWVLRRLPEWTRVRRELVAIAKEARDLEVGSRDEVFRTRCGAIAAACLEARPRKAAEAGIAREAQRKALDAAIADLAARLAAARGKLGALAQVVETPWRVPPAAAGLLAALREGAAAARGRAELGDAAGAEAAVRDALAAPGGAKDALEAWRTKLLELAVKLEASPAGGDAPWPASAAAVAQQAAARVRELLGSIGTLPPADTPTLASWLGSVHALQTHLDDGAARLAATWSLAIDAATAELQAISPNPLAGLAASLPARGDDPVDYLERIAAGGRAVVAAFGDRLLERISATSPERREIATLISQGGWSRAAALARRAIAAAQSAEGGVRGPDQPRPPLPAEPVAPAAAVARSIASLPVPAAAAPIVDLGALLRRTIRAEAIAAWATSAISFGLITVLYLLHYLPKDVGTWPELLAVFGQAFVLDLGVEAVVQGARSLVK